jgi:hypothetical protein
MTSTEYEYEIHVAETVRQEIVSLWQRGAPLPVITWDGEYNVCLHGGDPLDFQRWQPQFFATTLGILGKTYDEVMKDTIQSIDNHLKFLYMFAPDPC